MNYFRRKTRNISDDFLEIEDFSCVLRALLSDYGLNQAFIGDSVNNSLEKKQILEDSDFSYHFSRMIYLNRRSRKILSFEAIEDNSTDWLREKIDENNVTDEWQFYFNGPAPDSVMEEIRELLDR